MPGVGRRGFLVAVVGSPLVCSLARAQEIPEHNRASLEVAPLRPPAGDLSTRIPILFDAIV